MKSMIKILVVDDDPLLIQFTKGVLEAEGGFEVKAVTNASQAIPLVREFKPALVLLDVMMPGMLGTEIAEQIAGAADLRHIKVIFITAMRKKGEETQQGEFVGGQRIIAKPISSVELMSAIRKELDLQG